MNRLKEVNGIDVKRFFGIVKAVRKNPELMNSQFRTKNTWMDGGHSRSIIKGFYGARMEDNTRSEPYIFENDQPLILLGSDKGANPLEYILNALAGCITDSIVYNASMKGIQIDELESEMEGNFNLRNLFINQDDIDNPEDNIKVKIRISGNDLLEDEKSFLCDLGKRSSLVYKVITNAIPVEVSVENELYPDLI